MTLGAIVGIIINIVGPDTSGLSVLVKDIFPLVGSIFVRSLQL